MLNSGQIKQENFHYFTKQASTLSEFLKDQDLKLISKKDFDNFIEYSEQRLVDAYSRMDMQSQPWTKHTDKEVKVLLNYIPPNKDCSIIDIGCGTDVIGRFI